MLLPCWTALWLFLLLCGSLHCSSLPPSLASECVVECSPRAKCMSKVEEDMHTVWCDKLGMRVDKSEYFTHGTELKCSKKKSGGAYWQEVDSDKKLGRWRTIKTIECVNNLPCSAISPLVSNCHNDHRTCRKPNGFTDRDAQQLHCGRNGKEWISTTVPVTEMERVYYRMARIDCNGFSGDWSGVELGTGQMHIVPSGSNVRCVKEFEQTGNNTVYNEILTEGNNWKARHLAGFMLLLVTGMTGLVFSCIAYRAMRSTRERYASEHKNLKPLPFHSVWDTERVRHRRTKRKAVPLSPPAPNDEWTHVEEVEEMETAWEPTEFELSDTDDEKFPDENELSDSDFDEEQDAKADVQYRLALDFETDVAAIQKPVTSTRTGADSEVDDLVDSELSLDSGHSCYDEGDVDSEVESDASLEDDDPPRDPAVPPLVEVRLDKDYSVSSWSDDDLSDARPFVDSDAIPSTDSSDDDEKGSSEESEEEEDDEDSVSDSEEDHDEVVERKKAKKEKKKNANDADDERESEADLDDDDKYCRRRLHEWGDEDTDNEVEADAVKAYKDELRETAEVDARASDVPWSRAVTPPRPPPPRPKYRAMPLTEDQYEAAVAMDKYFLKQDRQINEQEDFDDDDLVEGVTLYTPPETNPPLPPIGIWGEPYLLPTADTRLVDTDDPVYNFYQRNSKVSKKMTSRLSIGGANFRAMRKQGRASRLISKRLASMIETPARRGHSNLINSQAEGRGGGSW